MSVCVEVKNYLYWCFVLNGFWECVILNYVYIRFNYILKFFGCFNDGSLEFIICLWCLILVYYIKCLEGDDWDKLGNLYFYVFVVCYFFEFLERNREFFEYFFKLIIFLVYFRGVWGDCIWNIIGLEEILNY